MRPPAGCGWSRPWSYDEAIDLLGRVARFGTNPTLEAIGELCDALGRPQDAFAVVQITGTNGKTSTSRMTAALLQAEGLRTALYTSPELERYPERMEVGGEVVSDADFALAIGAAADTAFALWGASEHDADIPARITEFELLTAAALWLFRERETQIAVLEVGLGGRWDATSVASPSVAVITGVGLDHMHILGDTLEEIAAEKAAIIRPASAPVLGPGTQAVADVFLWRARDVSTHARAVRASGEASPVDEALTVRFSVVAQPDSPGGTTTVDVTGIHGSYDALSVPGPAFQAGNIATAVAATEAALGRALAPVRAREALARMRVPGRFEVLRDHPPLVIDAAHNPQAAEVLAATIAQAWPDPAHRPVILLGILADKDAFGIVEALHPVVSRIAVTESVSPRAMPAFELADIVLSVTGEAPEEFATIREALAALVPVASDGLVVSGSITTAGQAKTAAREAGLLGG